MSMVRRVLIVLLCVSPVAVNAEQRVTLLQTTDQTVVVSGADRVLEVEDGDSFRVGAIRIRLFGIDAVEPKQECKLKDDRNCADAAREKLKELIAGKELVCLAMTRKSGQPWISYGGRYVSKCTVGDGAEDEVNRKMLEAGMAFVGKLKRAQEYLRLERKAQKIGIGVHHKSGVEHPADYRKRVREEGKTTSYARLREILKKRWSDSPDWFRKDVRSIVRENR